MPTTKINIKVLDDGQLPTKGSVEAAGWDMYSTQEHTIEPGQTIRVACGFILELPIGWEAQVRSRSGLAYGYAVHVLNGPGTIDSDFRGECAAILRNSGTSPFHITRGMRVAQMVFKKVPSIELMPVDVLTETARGSKGYGSSGV